VGQPDRRGEALLRQEAGKERDKFYNLIFDEGLGVDGWCSEFLTPLIIFKMINSYWCGPGADVTLLTCTLAAGRNLDWARGTGISRHKFITVYTPPGKIAHATVGFAGLWGALAGISAKGDAGDDSPCLA
jgi:hypothetical protein